MIVNDSVRQDKMGYLDGAVKSTEDLRRQVAKNKSEEKYLLDTKKDTPAEQWGIPLTAELFEQKLKKLNANFSFVEFPPSELVNLVIQGKWPVDQPWHHKQLFISTPEGRTRVCLYPRHILPEYTIMWGKDVVLPNPEYISNPDRIGKPTDIPNLKSKDIREDWGEAPKDSPLYIYSHIPHGTALRGYREVLAICIMAKFITLAQVEQEFGPGSSAEWKMKILGNKVDERPW